MFNDGGVTFISVMEEMGLEAGQFARQCFMDKDTLRVKNAQRQAREATHETRIARRQGRRMQDEQQKEREGLSLQCWWSLSCGMSGRSDILFGFIAVLCFVRVWFLRSKSYAKIAGLCWFLHDFFFFFFF